MARPQPFTVEVPKGTEPGMARQLQGIQQNFRTLFVDIGSAGGSVDVANSIEEEDESIQLVNDDASPGNTKYYGTDSSGVKGFHSLTTSEWDSVAVKASDQDVTNSTVLVDETDLQLTVTAGSFWLIEFLLSYSASNATQDISFAIAVSAGAMSGALHVIGLGAANSGIAVSVALAEVALSAQTDLGTAAAGALRPARAIGYIMFSADATFKLQFAQRAAGVGTYSRMETGCVRRAQQLI